MSRDLDPDMALFLLGVRLPITFIQLLIVPSFQWLPAACAVWDPWHFLHTQLLLSSGYHLTFVVSHTIAAI